MKGTKTFFMKGTKTFFMKGTKTFFVKGTKTFFVKGTKTFFVKGTKTFFVEGTASCMLVYTVMAERMLTGDVKFFYDQATENIWELIVLRAKSTYSLDQGVHPLCIVTPFFRDNLKIHNTIFFHYWRPRKNLYTAYMAPGKEEYINLTCSNVKISFALRWFCWYPSVRADSQNTICVPTSPKDGIGGLMQKRHLTPLLTHLSYVSFPFKYRRSIYVDPTLVLSPGYVVKGCPKSVMTLIWRPCNGFILHTSPAVP